MMDDQKRKDPERGLIKREDQALLAKADGNLIRRGADLAKELASSPRARFLPRLLRRFQAHTQATVALTFSRDGALLASTGDELIKIWDVQTLAEYRSLRGHRHAVKCADFVPGLRQLISGDRGGSIIVWDIERGTKIIEYPGTPKVGRASLLWPDTVPAGAGFELAGIKVLPDAKHAVSVAEDDCARLWDYARGENIAVYKGPFDCVYGFCRFSEDGSKFLTTGLDEVFFWSRCFDGNSLVTPIGKHELQTVGLSQDGRFAALTEYDEAKTVLLELSTLGVVKELLFPYVAGEAEDTSAEPDALTLAAARWDAGVLETTVDNSDYEPDMMDFGFDQQKNITVLAFSEDNRHLIGGFDSGELFMFDLENARLKWKVKGHTGDVESIAISPAGNLAASGGADGDVVLWGL